MDDVLQADQRDEQDGKGGAPSEEIAKEICKEKSNKANIETENTNR